VGTQGGPGESGLLCIPKGDFLWFVDQALDEILEVLRRAGDDVANRPPGIEGANTLYALATHCLGVMEDWGGHHVRGREIQRDREAEFVATGPVADLIARAAS
jgi:hypothetical protein